PAGGINAMNTDFGGETRGTGFVQTPVQSLFELSVGRTAAPTVLLVILRTGQECGPRGAGPNEVENVNDLGIGTLLQTGLEIGFLRVFGGLRNRAGVVNRVSQRGFAIDVFARLKGLNDD